jgi:hypothetical protein
MWRKSAPRSVPIIGSLNGTTSESWLTFSRQIEQAGANAIELNMYEVVADATISGAAIEHQIIQVASELKQFLKIPVAIKLSPFFASLGNVVHRLDQAGAAGVVLFNRFYQPDIDVEELQIMSDVRLSTSAERGCAFAGSRFFTGASTCSSRLAALRRPTTDRASGGRGRRPGRVGGSSARAAVSRDAAHRAGHLDGAQGVRVARRDARETQPARRRGSVGVRARALLARATQLEARLMRRRI